MAAAGAAVWCCLWEGGRVVLPVGGRPCGAACGRAAVISTGLRVRVELRAEPVSDAQAERLQGKG